MFYLGEKYKAIDFQDCYSREDGITLILPGELVEIVDITDKNTIFRSRRHAGELALANMRFREIFRRVKK